MTEKPTNPTHTRFQCKGPPCEMQENCGGPPRAVYHGRVIRRLKRRMEAQLRLRLAKREFGIKSTGWRVYFSFYLQYPLAEKLDCLLQARVEILDGFPAKVITSQGDVGLPLLGVVIR